MSYENFKLLQFYTVPRGDCERPCFYQVNAHIIERLLFCWRSKIGATRCVQLIKTWTLTITLFTVHNNIHLDDIESSNKFVIFFQLINFNVLKTCILFSHGTRTEAARLKTRRIYFKGVIMFFKAYWPYQFYLFRIFPLTFLIKNWFYKRFK